MHIEKDEPRPGAPPWLASDSFAAHRRKTLLGAAAMRIGVERRVRFVLRRIRWRVPRAEVVFSDVNGPRGGVDKRCQVELRRNGHGPVVVSSVSTDWRTALDDALSQICCDLTRLRRRIDALRRLRHRTLDTTR
jgi:hypothetical protein